MDGLAASNDQSPNQRQSMGSEADLANLLAFPKEIDPASLPEVSAQYLLECLFRAETGSVVSLTETTLGELDHKSREWLTGGNAPPELQVFVGQLSEDLTVAAVIGRCEDRIFVAAHRSNSFCSRGDISTRELLNSLEYCEREDWAAGLTLAELVRHFQDAAKILEPQIESILFAKSLVAVSPGTFKNSKLQTLAEVVYGLLVIEDHASEVEESSPPEWARRFSLVSYELIKRSKMSLDSLLDSEKKSARAIIREVIPDIASILGADSLVQNLLLRSVAFLGRLLRREEVFLENALPLLPEIERKLIQLYLAVRVGGGDCDLENENALTTASPQSLQDVRDISPMFLA